MVVKKDLEKEEVGGRNVLPHWHCWKLASCPLGLARGKLTDSLRGAYAGTLETSPGSVDLPLGSLHPDASVSVLIGCLKLLGAYPALGFSPLRGLSPSRQPPWTRLQDTPRCISY